MQFKAPFTQKMSAVLLKSIMNACFSVTLPFLMQGIGGQSITHCQTQMQLGLKLLWFRYQTILTWNVQGLPNVKARQRQELPSSFPHNS